MEFVIMMSKWEKPNSNYSKKPGSQVQLSNRSWRIDLIKKRSKYSAPDLSDKTG